MSGECADCSEHVLECRCMSRPEKKIDWQRVDELLEAGCLGTEIAAYFGMHSNTFYVRMTAHHGMGFSEYSSQKKSSGEALIREAQYKKAIKKLDNTMLIWLGKQRLGQRENSQEETVGADIIKHYESVMKQLASLQSPSSVSAESLDSMSTINQSCTVSNDS